MDREKSFFKSQFTTIKLTNDIAGYLNRVMLSCFISANILEYKF